MNLFGSKAATPTEPGSAGGAGGDRKIDQGPGLLRRIANYTKNTISLGAVIFSGYTAVEHYRTGQALKKAGPEFVEAHDLLRQELRTLESAAKAGTKGQDLTGHMTDLTSGADKIVSKTRAIATELVVPETNTTVTVTRKLTHPQATAPKSTNSP